MIKLLYVINFIRYSGPSNVVRNIIYNIDKTKYEVTVFTLFKNENDPEVVKELRNLNITVVEQNFKSRAHCFFTKELNDYVSENNFDIIHSHGLIPDMLNARCKTAAIRISTIHCNIFEDYLQTYGYLKGKIIVFLHIKYLNKLDCQVCCSKSVHEVLKSYLTNSCYIRNGIVNTSSNIVVSREELGISENAFVFIFIGRWIKNVDFLLKQFEKYHNNDEYLLVLGRGAEESQHKDIKDKNIKLIGFKKNVSSYLQISDIYASASLSEGFSIALCEALDNGLGLFVSDIPSHSETFEIDESIYLGETFNENNFAEKLELLRKNKQRLDSLKIKKFKDRFLSSEHMTNQYTDVYTSCKSGGEL